MSIRTVWTTQSDPRAAAEHIKQQLAGFEPRFVIYFVAPSYDPAQLGQALKQVMDGPAIGCTTAGELVGGKMLDDSLVVMAFDDQHVERVSVAKVKNTRSDSEVREAYAELIGPLGPIGPEDAERVIGLVLQDGLSGAEEAVMSTLSTLSNVPFVGGSAGDGGKFKQTHVFVNHEPSSGSVALALLKLRNRYQIVKTQSFDVGDQVMAVTRADEANRLVMEFNGKPAAEEYARVLNSAAEKLNENFQNHPLGLIVGGEPYVRSPQQLDGTSVRFYCNIKEGMELSVLSARDIVKDTAQDLDAAIRDFGPVAGLINFNCILRTTELKQKNQGDSYAALFEPYTSVGFSTYGESYVGHINHTSVILLFS